MLADGTHTSAPLRPLLGHGVAAPDFEDYSSTHDWRRRTARQDRKRNRRRCYCSAVHNVFLCLLWYLRL